VDEHIRAEKAHELGALVDTFGDAALIHFAKQVAELDPARRKAIQRLARGS